MLKARKNIKQREIQEDSLSVYYKKITRFFQENTKYVQIGLGAFVLILVVTLLMARSKRSAEFTSASKLGIAENLYFQKQFPGAITEFEKISADFPGTKAAGKSIFYLASIYFNQKEYQRAEQYFQDYLDKQRNDPIYKSSAMAGIAACLGNKEQYEKAADLYLNAWKVDKESFSAVTFLDNAAMNYKLAGNSEKAKETYKLIIDEYPKSSLFNKASHLIEVL